jgi:hypothetical protein
MTSAASERQQAPAPTFSKDVAPILFANCAGCHRPTGLGPMSLLTYEDAQPFASAIRDEVETGHMPPWHAEGERGTFLNDRRLSDIDKTTLSRWVDAGTPRGDAADLPPVPAFAEGWTIGEPDVVFPIPEAYPVPATGTIPYVYFQVPTNFTEDRWVQAIEILPGARSVVHHALVYANSPSGADGAARRVDSGESPSRRLGSLIATTAPGANAMVYRPDKALRIRAGAVLTFQMHYTANGEAVRDRTSVGLVLADGPPLEEIVVSHFLNGRFVIPAGAPDHRVNASVDFDEDVHLLGLFPHTHLRGTRWHYRLTYPDGRTEVILDVPGYDFNWQTYYMFAEPLAIPKGSRIVSSAWYDNSDGNPSNPDPSRDVRWGDQTWEEMQYTGITYTVDGAPSPRSGGR